MAVGGLLAKVGLATAGSHPVVRRLLVCQLLLAAVSAWTFGSVFDADVFIIAGQSNSFVGLVESARGLAGLLVAVPLGFLADQVPRLRLLRMWTLASLPVGMVMAAALLTKVKWLLIFGSVLYAVIDQALAGVLQAMLADTTAPGPERDEVMGEQTIVRQLGQSGGALLNLVFVLSSDGSWSPDVLGRTLTAGLALLVLNLPICWTVVQQPISSVRLTGDAGCNTESCASSVDEDAVPMWAQRLVCGGRVPVKWVVVVLLETSFVLSLLCSGMSVKYFPLFFKQDFGFSPAAICILNAAFPLVVTVCVRVCVRLSQRIGRVPGMILFTCLGASFLLVLARCRVAWMAVAAFLLRNAFMKSRDAPIQALLMDCLAKEHRGRFGSVLSLRSATWAGSSWLGGLLLDHHQSNYRLVFEFTVLMTLVPIAAMLPLLLIVPRKTVAGEVSLTSGEVSLTSGEVSLTSGDPSPSSSRGQCSVMADAVQAPNR